MPAIGNSIATPLGLSLSGVGDESNPPASYGVVRWGLRGEFGVAKPPRRGAEPLGWRGGRALHSILLPQALTMARLSAAVVCPMGASARASV